MLLCDWSSDVCSSDLGYNFADYWQHWLSVGQRLKSPPRIFHVNWFRQDASGRFIWPGFGDNLRVLKWIVDRVAGRADAVETPIGYMPAPEDLDLAGLELRSDAIGELLALDAPAWRADLEHLGTEFMQYGERLPKELLAELEGIVRRLG
jgi:phosphoenolpyruvate carboxykinase (GTP)